MVKFFFHLPPNVWQMMTFLNPLDTLIPRFPFSFFAEVWVRVTSEAPGASLVRILWVPSIEPFLGEGGVPAGGLYRPPPPPGSESPPAPAKALEPLGGGVWKVCLNTPLPCG